MKTSTFLYRALDFGSKKTPRLKAKKEAFVDYTWKAIEEHRYYELKDILNPAEFLAFLPVQRLSREQGLAKKCISKHGEDEFVKRCISFGLQRLRWYNPEFYSEAIDIRRDYSDLFYDLPLNQRLESSNYPEDLWQLQLPPAKVMTTKEVREHDAEMIMNNISAKEQIRRGELIIESPVDKNKKSKAPLIAQKLWQIARRYDKERKKRDVTTVKENYFNTTPRPHLSTSQMLRNYDKWESMFLTKNGHNTKLAKFLLHSYVDLEQANSQAIRLIESLPFSMFVPILASTQFYKQFLPKDFEKSLYLSSDHFIEKHVGNDPYTNYFLGSFKRKTHSKSYKEEELALDPEISIPIINPKWFDVPRQTIMSPTKAERYDLQGKVIEVSLYPTRPIPELERKLEEEREARTGIVEEEERVSKPLSEESQFYIRRRLINGVREYIRDSLQIRLNEKTRHKKTVLEDRLL